MTSIAELGIRIDSGDAVQATDNLDRLAQAGGKAEKAAAGVASSFDKASAAAGGLAAAEDRVAESTEEAMARLTAMAKASLESSQYYQNLSSSVNSTSSAMDGGASSARDWNAELAAINSRAQALLATEDRLAEEARKAAAATRVQAEGLQTLLGKINPAIAALGKLDEQQAQLQKYKSAGLIDADTFSEYSGRIDASRQKLGDFDDSLQKTGVSSAQTQAALRQLPAQFTDIFTSLAGGQNPLLVLIQQGGQIADSFGGIGPTLDVLGGKIKSVLGLGGGIGVVGDALETVGSGAKAAAEGADAAGESLGAMAEGANTAADAAKNAREAAGALNAATPPLTIGFGVVVTAALSAAAAIGAVIYGYAQGSKEGDKFGDTLILTGNRAGTTADQLATMAQQVSAANGTIGEAAASLVLIANSGTIAGDSFKTVAEAAANMEDATGKSVEKTVAEFAKIGKDPVAAAKELNAQYGFLTASVYSQIVALKEQGDTIGAAKILTDTYASTINDRSAEIVKNLGLWEKGWKAVSDGAKDAIDSIKEVGREQTLADQITDAQRRVAYAESAVKGNSADTDAEEKLKNSRLELEYLTRQRDTQSAIAAARALDAQRQQATVLAMTKVDVLEKAARTNAEKRADALKDYAKSLETIRKTDANDARLKPENVARVKANIAEQFKDPKAPSAGAVDLTAFNDAQNQLKSITGYYDNIQKELDAAQKAGLVSAESYSSQRMAIVEQEKGDVTAAYEAEIAALEAARAKGTTSAEQRIQLDQKIADARASMVKAQQDADTQLNVLASNEQGRLKKQEQAVKTYTDALQQQVATLRGQGQRSAATLGMGDRQQGLYSQQNSINDRINQQKLDLANQYGDGARGMSLDEYNQKLGALDRTQRDLQETAVANYNDMTAAQGDWSAGASSAFQNYLESARDVAGQTKSLFTSAFSSMEDGIVNFAMTGKFSFSDFTKSILADMARIAARQASSSALSGLFGLATSAASSYFGAGSGNGLAAGSAGAVSSDLGASSAGYSSAYFQADGGAWSNGVQMFANGGAFTNSIVSTPTAFGMANGKTGIMGEDGDEAVMPLTRTSSGKLGVMSIGGGGAGSTQINVEVHIDGEGNASSTADAPGYELFGKELATFVEQKYQELRTKDMRQGGVINNAIKGR
ncbi:phage tail tape measure protein [Pseudomonas cichorii]|uniref:phage tail tape measure protein n=1 Tax=Pseudomonas cichorii TaxID=36746 RepID=UPI001C8A2B52|nr:phage tail tape measure protein [Pseudomonas cichorii]MBX8528558.1 phage tail tape measure protein [Pseudomonas cichorii]